MDLSIADEGGVCRLFLELMEDSFCIVCTPPFAFPNEQVLPVEALCNDVKLGFNKSDRCLLPILIHG